MSEKSTLGELSRTVNARKATLSDEVVSLKTLLMDAAQPGHIIVRRPGGAAEVSYPITDRIYAQASTVIYGLPGGYLEKLVTGKNGDPALAALNFNHWVAQNQDREVLLRFRTIAGQRILRAMMPATWNRIPYEDSIATLISKFGEDKEISITSFDEDVLVVDLVTKQLEMPLRDGHKRIDDPFEWGMRFRDSDTGLGSLNIGPYTRRRICSNGASVITQGASIVIAHTGKDSKIPTVVQSHLRQGCEMVDGYAQHFVAQIEASRNITLDLTEDENGVMMPLSALARVNKDNGVTNLMDKHVRESWIAEQDSIPNPTVYRLANAFTRAGTHAEELDMQKRLHLQSVGGKIFQLSTQDKYIWN